MRLKLILIFVSIFFIGCKEKSKDGISKIHWDRDMCARCVMVVSDRTNTLQLSNPNNGKKYVFDDIGCMVLWFKEENVEWKDKAKIWITSKSSGEWIDARKAFYSTQNITPMAYGYSAYKSRDEIKNSKDIIDFIEVSKRVLALESNKSH